MATFHTGQKAHRVVPPQRPALTARGGERRGRFALRLDHRGFHIKKKRGRRAAHRRGRCTRNLRYRPPRFRNRALPGGWLPPSLHHRVATTTAWVERLARWAPVRAVHVERVAFDTHALSTDQSSPWADSTPSPQPWARC